MIGGRQNLAELMSGSLLPALQAFNRTGESSDAFFDNEGCLVNGEGFITFPGICDEAGLEVDARARDLIDELLRIHTANAKY
jgi:hypothetical protein